MLDTHGVRDPPIVKRLTLGHYVLATFGLAPGTSDNHALLFAAP
jgi:hypothetical protein